MSSAEYALQQARVLGDGAWVRVTVDAQLSIEDNPNKEYPETISLKVAKEGGRADFTTWYLSIAGDVKPGLVSVQAAPDPFKPPAEGKLFRSLTDDANGVENKALFVSFGPEGFRCVRTVEGKPYRYPHPTSGDPVRWRSMVPSWLDAIEVVL